MFADWLDGLRDAVAVKRIKQRLARVQIGLFGDVVVILLCGGNKGSQKWDIARAKDINKEVED